MLEDIDPRLTAGGVLLGLAAIFWKPVADAIRKRLVSQETAVTAQATLHATRFRAEDDWTQKLVAQAQRAQQRADDAIAEKNATVEASREDTHRARNAAMLEIAAFREKCESEIKLIERAAEKRMADKDSEILGLIRNVENLTARFEACSARNEELTRQNARLLRQFGFDPNATDTKAE